MQGSEKHNIIFTDISFGYTDRVSCPLGNPAIIPADHSVNTMFRLVPEQIYLAYQFRPIVVRQPNGVLRTATWDERERMLQTYLTLPSKEMITPAMFSDPYLKDVLQKGW